MTSPVGGNTAEPRPPTWSIALHTWTLGQRPLLEVLEVAGRAGYDAVELNWQDLQRCPDEGASSKAIIDLVAASAVEVAVVGAEPGWLFATGEEARDLWDGFRRTAEMAAALGCGTLMSAVGRHLGPIGHAERNLAKASEVAAQFGLDLALEFNFQHPVLHSLAMVRDLVSSTARTNCGLVLDTYHLHRGGSAGRGFAYVPVEEIFHFQFSDVPEHPDLGPDVPVDRLPPGQGHVQWLDVIALLREKGYTRSLSYEAPNPALWCRPPDDVAQEGLEAFHGLLALALPKVRTRE